MELNWETLKQPKVINYLILAVILVILSFMYYKLVYVPLQMKIASLEKELEKKSKELETIREMKKNLVNLQNEVKKAEIELEKLKSMFPEKKEVARLMFDITKLAKFHNIMIVRFLPVGDITKPYYMEYKYSLEVKGRYHNLGAFLADMANLTLIINTDKLEIKALNFKNVEDFENINETLKASMEITTYSSKKE